MLLISETCVNIFGKSCFKDLASVLEKMLISFKRKSLKFSRCFLCCTYYYYYFDQALF